MWLTPKEHIPISPPLVDIFAWIFAPFIVMLFQSCKKNPIIFRFFPRSQKPFTLISLFKFLLFITSWKIDIFLRYLAHVFSLHISSIGANIKPFEWTPFEKKPVKEKWVVPVSPLSVIILNREFQKYYLLDISCSSYEFGCFIKTGKWVLKIEKATNQAILFELAMVMIDFCWNRKYLIFPRILNQFFWRLKKIYILN